MTTSTLWQTLVYDRSLVVERAFWFYRTRLGVSKASHI